MNKRTKQIIFVVILVVGIHYFFQKWPEFIRLLDLSFSNFIKATLLIFSSFLILGLKFKCLLGSFKTNLLFREWSGFPMIMGTGNQFFFKGGTVAIAVYLKLKHQLSYKKFIAIAIVDKVFLLYSLSWLGIVVACCLYFEKVIDVYGAFIFFIFPFVFTYLLYFSGIRVSLKTNKMIIYISILLEAWNNYKTELVSHVKIIILHMFYIISWALRFFIAFKIINFSVDFMQCIVMSYLAFLVGLINVVPGALGVREAVVGLSLAFFGDDFDHGVFATALDRVLVTFWSLLSAFLYLNILQIKGFQRDPIIAQELK